MMDLQAIEALYKREIDSYQRQIDELRNENRTKNETNTNLLQRLQTLNELVEKSNIVNKDLHSAFEHVREENAKLKAISNVSHERLPVQLQQTNESDMALEKTRHQFINLASESVSWLTEKDKLLQRIKFLERECERYFRDNSTLGKQVRHLLTTLEQERGMIIRHNNQVKEYNNQLVTGLDVIDQHLVTFESIEELQQQNQKLISLVKKLSKEQEENDMRLETEEIKKLTTDIDSLKTQLESVQNDRERIMEAFKTLLKERELFKILLCKTKQVEHMTPEIFQRMVSIACSSGPAIGLGEPEDTHDKDAHIVDLKSMISKLEQEISDLKADSEASSARKDEELRLKTDLLEQAHLKLSAESQQAQILNERISLLETNTKSLMVEYDETRTRLQKTTFEMEQMKKEKQSISDLLEQEKVKSGSETLLRDQNKILEATITSLKDELTENRTKSQLLALQFDHLGKEKAMLADNLEQERRLRQTELSNILSEIQTRSEMMNQEKLKSQAEIKWVEQNKALEATIANLRNELSEKQIRINSLTSKLDEYNEEKRKLQCEILEFQKLRDIEREQRLKLEPQLRQLRNESTLKIKYRKKRNHFQPEKSDTYVENNVVQEEKDENMIVQEEEPDLHEESTTYQEQPTSLNEQSTIILDEPSMVQEEYCIGQEQSNTVQMLQDTIIESQIENKEVQSNIEEEQVEAQEESTNIQIADNSARADSTIPSELTQPKPVQVDPNDQKHEEKVDAPPEKVGIVLKRRRL